MVPTATACGAWPATPPFQEWLDNRRETLCNRSSPFAHSRGFLDRAESHLYRSTRRSPALYAATASRTLPLNRSNKWRRCRAPPRILSPVSYRLCTPWRIAVSGINLHQPHRTRALAEITVGLGSDSAFITAGNGAGCNWNCRAYRSTASSASFTRLPDVPISAPGNQPDETADRWEHLSFQMGRSHRHIHTCHSLQTPTLQRPAHSQSPEGPRQERSRSPASPIFRKRGSSLFPDTSFMGHTPSHFSRRIGCRVSRTSQTILTPADLVPPSHGVQKRPAHALQTVSTYPSGQPQDGQANRTSDFWSQRGRILAVRSLLSVAGANLLPVDEAEAGPASWVGRMRTATRKQALV